MQVTQNEIRREANRILAECQALAPDAFEGKPRISFKVSSRMTRAAGKARPSTGEITLSVAFFADRQNFEKDFRNTVTHEIAHILSPPVRVGRKRSSHGPAWKAMHRRLGGTGDRCHELELSAGYTARRKSVPCPCGCGKNMTLGPTQYRHHLSGQEKYYLKGHTPNRGRKNDPLSFF